MDITFDACITDLPYGTTSNQWDSIIPFEPMWNELNKLIKDNGVKIFTASQPFTSLLICSNLKEFKHEWIWQKNRGSNFANTVREPFKEHEEVIIFCKQGNWTYNKQMQERAESGKNGMRFGVEMPMRKILRSADDDLPPLPSGYAGKKSVA